MRWITWFRLLRLTTLFRYYWDELHDSLYWDELLDLDYRDELLDSNYQDELLWFRLLRWTTYLDYWDELLV